MLLRFFFAGCASIALLVGQSTATWGQGRMGGNAMSAFGGGNSGFGASGTGGFGNSGFGGSRFGSSGFGNSGIGNSGFGNSGFGSSGFGAGQFGGGGIGNSGFGRSGFGNQAGGLGGGYGGGQNFVGRDSGDMAATFNRAGTQFFTQMNRNLARRNRDRNQTQTIENAPQPVRVQLQVAFDAPRPTSATVASNLRSRLGKILAEHNIAQPLVTMEGDTAVLRGVATTESQRLVLENLIALEPGVRQVRNEMTVIATPEAAASSPATGD